MPSPARASRWNGPVRKPLNNFLAAAALLMLAGCSQWPPRIGVATPAHAHLEFLARASSASPAARELMWRESVAHGSPEESQLRRALLLSVPGSARYNPAKAETELRSLLAADPPAEVAAVARMRLEALLSSGECREQVDILKKRLSKIADIERGSDEPGSVE